MNKQEEFLKKLYQLCEEYNAEFYVFGYDVEVYFEINSNCYIWPTRSINTLSIGKYLNKLKSE